MVMYTPNSASLSKYLFGRHWRGWETPRHLHVFSPESLMRLAERAGIPNAQWGASGVGGIYVLDARAVQSMKHGKRYAPYVARGPIGLLVAEIDKSLATVTNMLLPRLDREIYLTVRKI